MLSKYKVTSELSRGTFGRVFEGIHKRTGEQVAIKMEKRGEMSSLKHEARIYHYLKDVDGVPSLKWFGTDEHNSFLILPLLGLSLKEKRNEGSFAEMQLERMAKCACNILQNIHTSEIIHGDIKPENFILDRDEKKLYLIDFGFSRAYTGEIRKTTSSIGTPNYMSINVHKKYEPKYIDDIESLLYTCLFLYYGKLPWSECGEKTNDIMRRKQQVLHHQDYIPSILKGLFVITQEPRENDLPNYNLFV